MDNDTFVWSADQPKQATLLIVDDNQPRLASMGRALSQAGWQVVTATSGAQGLTLWEQTHPDLAIIDVVLPDLSGLEVCRLIKSEAATHRTIVILLSGQQKSSEVQALGLEEGADGYITYPLSMREMVARVGAALRLKQSEDARRAADLRFRLLFEHMQEGLALHRLIHDDMGQPIDYQIIEANPAHEGLTGIARDQALVTPASALYGTCEPPYFDIYAEVVRSGTAQTFETFFAPLGKHFAISAFSWGEGLFATAFVDITARIKAESDRETLIADLRAALDEVQELHGLLPICMHCKKIRDDGGYWSSVEDYVTSHSKVIFSHGLCPDCLRKEYPELADEILSEGAE